ncbi:MAG: OmpA family protein [Bacteroidales bacterium]|nr:OmpA family protein [Bacteroidales bacterium]
MFLKNGILFLFFILFTSFLFSQEHNLVPNNGFEVYSICPNDYTHWNSTYRRLTDNWIYPTKGTPDYFNTCSHGIAGVPRNFAGTSNAYNGNAYVGVVSRGSRKNYREYIAAELLDSLEVGVKYCVKFKFKLSSYSRYAIEDFGVFLSKKIVRTQSDGVLGIEPHIKNPEDNWFDNKIDWGEFCGTYIAEGGETQIIIGNFASDDSTDVVETDISDVHPKRVKDYAYYYIDDVEVKAIIDCYVCTCSMDNVVDAAIEPSNVTFFGGNDGVADLTVYYGTEPHTFLWSNGETTEDIDGLTEGYYFVEVADANQCKYSFDIVIEQPDSVFANIEEGVAKTLKNVFFKFDKDELLESSYKQLNDLVNFMKYNSSIEIRILGHTDEKGKGIYNQSLSVRRAKTVVDYLQHEGIAPERLLYMGYGESRPVADNTTDEGRQLNRRVEFEVTKK